jgi:hypothetical protein
MKCPVCFDGNALERGSAADGYIVEIECQRCGRFRYSGPASRKLEGAATEKRALVCGWLWEQTRFGSVPKIDTNVDALLAASPLPFLEKAKRLLIHLSERGGPLGKPFGEELASPRLDSMLETLDHRDVGFVQTFCTEQGWVKQSPSGGWHLTGSGLLRADEWKQSTPASGQAFVAMWFHESTSAAWTDGLQKGITAADSIAASHAKAPLRAYESELACLRKMVRWARSDNTNPRSNFRSWQAIDSAPCRWSGRFEMTVRAARDPRAVEA